MTQASAMLDTYPTNLEPVNRQDLWTVPDLVDSDHYGH